MDWFQAKTVKELKTFGSFKEVRQKIDNQLGGKLVLKVRGWEDLLKAAKILQSLLPAEEQDTSKTSSLYFKSESARIIYALVQLDGEQRLKELGVDKSFVREPEKAKKWRNNFAKLIHPDVCKHPEAADASTQLTKLYEKMTDR